MARASYESPFTWMKMPIQKMFAWIDSINEVEAEDKDKREKK